MVNGTSLHLIIHFYKHWKSLLFLKKMGYKCPCHLEIETAKVLETYFIDLKHTILAKVLGKLKFMDLTYSTFPFGVKISTWVNQNFLLYKINYHLQKRNVGHFCCSNLHTNVPLFVLRREISIVSIKLLNCEIVCIYF